MKLDIPSVYTLFNFDRYDFLVFWKDKSKIESWHPRTPKLSGSGYSCNFPGFGGRPPLVIESDRYGLSLSRVTAAKNKYNTASDTTCNGNTVLSAVS